MDALGETIRMADKGVTLDVMTPVMRSIGFSDGEIGAAYDALAQTHETVIDSRGIVSFRRTG